MISVSSENKPERSLILAKKIVVLTFFILSTLSILQSCSKPRKEPVQSGNNVSIPDRIISLSPSTTEIVFALGMGDRLAGVSRFCDYPPETADIPEVGGYLDTNYEAIAALGPDLVLLLPEQEDAAEYLSGIGIRTMTVDNKTVGDILGAIDTLGHRLGAENEATALLKKINERIKRISNEDVAEKARVLVSIGHDFGSGRVDEVFAAGQDTYYDEILGMAGGSNVCSGIPVSYPVVSAEGIISMDPEIIIELVMPGSAGNLTDKEILKDWAFMSSVEAVRNGKVYILRKDYAHIPGPRFIFLLEDMVEVIRGVGKNE
ncbi:MAG: ABC transporter substrate-binding protein [Candidatus Krumholzibacteria bacterium]|nr:ABC transporter substrate-binding protein [Candidatus Krumholzibacteria bacterium]